MEKTLLDLGRVPTLDEHWETLAREMGVKSSSEYYSKDNPLIAMRDNFENLVAGGVHKLITEQPEKAETILYDFMNEEGEFDGNADKFLRNAIETAMKVMDFEEVADIIQSSPAYEDFNHNGGSNYRAADFDRKWNHTRTKIQTVNIDDHPEVAGENDFTDDVIANIKQDNFGSSLCEEDKKLLRLRLAGLTQAEIAKELGYKTHSAVTKRLQRLKDIFEQCA